MHLIIEQSVDGELHVLPALRELLANDFGLGQITVQCEKVACRDVEPADHFAAR